MKTLSAGSTLAVSRQYAAPSYLLQIDFTAPSATTLYLSDHYVEVFSQQWLPYVAGWGNLEAVLNTSDVGGAPATATISLINTKPVLTKSRLSDLIRTPLNTTGAYEWAFAKATVYHYFEGLTTTADRNPLGVFYLEDPQDIGEDILQLRMSDQTLVIDRSLDVYHITRFGFPLCAPSSINREVPRAFGAVPHVPCWPVVDGAVSQLDSAITETQTTVTLLDASEFPETPTMYGAAHWSQFGLDAFVAANVNDGSASTLGFHLDNASVGNWLRFDAGVGATATFAALWITFEATSPTGAWAIEHSDDAVAYTVTATLTFSGLSAATSWPASTHRYWRLRLTTDPGPGPSHAEVQFYSFGFLGQCQQEQMQWKTRSGNQLQTVLRGRNGTTALAHDDGSSFFLIRSGAKAYRYVVAEDIAGFPIKSLSNIRVNGEPTTLATTELGVTNLVAGRTFAVVNFNANNVRTFHCKPIEGHSLSLPVETNVPLQLDQTIDSVGNNTWQFLLTVTLQPPAEPYTVSGTVSRHVVMTFAQPSGSFSLSGTNTIRHRDPSNGTITLFSDNTGPGFDFTGATYDYTTGSNITNETFELNLSGDADTWRFIWTITVYTLSGATLTSVPQAGFATGPGSGASTTAIVIGNVSCDIEGTQDDASGTISGTANLLLTNPADIVRVSLLHLWPGIPSGQLGPSFAATRSSLASAGITWAYLMGFDNFAKWRLRFSEQARSQLYLTAGTWEYKFLPSTPAAQQTLDYLRDLSAASPAAVTRSARVDVKNSLTVSSEYDYVDREYQTSSTHEDLTQVGLTEPLRGELNLDLVRNAATATALGDFWLGQWKRQRFLVDLIAWWNILAVEPVDYLAFSNHPILEAHGGAGLVFRVIGTSSLIADEHSGRIRLRLIEAGT